jgi:replicative DNA helicase
MTEKTARCIKDEENLIGALIVKPEAIYIAQEYVTATDFVSIGFSQVFFAIQALLKKAVPLNATNIAAELDRIKVLDLVGGVSRLVELMAEGMPHHVQYYAEQVAKASQRRKLRRVIDDLAKQCEGDEFDPVEFAGEMSAASTIIDGAGVEQKRLGLVLDEFLEQCEENRQSKSTSVFATGIERLDESLFGGLPAGYITIGARPSIGKSAVGAEIALRPARDRNEPTLFVSLEMSFRQFALRFMLRGTSLKASDINQSTYTDAQLNEMLEVAADHHLCPMEFWHKPGATIAAIESRIRTDIARRGCKLVVIDYIQLIKAPREISDRRLQVSHVSNEICRMSKQLNIPIVVLAQVGRAAEGEAPTLSHLKESGSIEEDSDIVMLLHREDRAAEKMDVYIAKFRDGEMSKTELSMRRGAVYSTGDREFKVGSELTNYNGGF